MQQKSISNYSGAASEIPSETFLSFKSSINSKWTPSDTPGYRATIDNDKDLSSDSLDGFQSWVACVVAFFDTLLLFGLLNIYSLFLIEFQQELGVSTASAASLGSLTLGLFKLFGPISSYLTMRFGNRKVMMLGSLFCSASTFGSSYVGKFNMLFATFGIPFALGTAMVNVPAFVVPMEYFRQYRAITTGIIASGSSMGTLILAPVAQLVLELYGWRTTFRWLAVSFFMLILANAQIQPLKRATTKAPANGNTTDNERSICNDLKLWNNRVFVLWVSAIAIVYFGYNIPVMFLASYTVYIGSTTKDAAFILMTMGAATTVSRLATGGLMTCDLLSKLHAKQVIFVIMGTVHLLLAHVTTIQGLYIFAVVRGLLDGVHIVMLPTLTASIVGAKKAILGWGHLAGAISITYTLGPLLAGLILDETGSYVLPFIMAGLPLIAAGLLLFLLPWAQRSYQTKRQNKQMFNLMEKTGDITSIPDFENFDIESIEDFIQQQAEAAEMKTM